MDCIYGLVMLTFMNIKIERLAKSPDLSGQQQQGWFVHHPVSGKDILFDQQPPSWYAHQPVSGRDNLSDEQPPSWYVHHPVSGKDDLSG